MTIPHWLLDSLERFFGAKFSDVRLLTGSVLPDLVGARAIAWNNQIWLSDLSPEFFTPSMVRLLAHEFAHICQQRAASARPFSPSKVGEAHDPLEAEADACAQAFVAGRRCPPLTADSAATLRRTLSIVPGSAKITADFSKAKPTIVFPIVGGTQRAVCHLTTGFVDIDTISDALFWKGEGGGAKRRLRSS